MTDASIRYEMDLFEFPQDQHLLEMLAWLGEDYVAAIADSMRKGFQKQQPGTRLIAVRCLGRPELDCTRGRLGEITNMRAAFPLSVVLTDPQKTIWWLEVEAVFNGRNLNRPQKSTIATDVKVTRSEHPQIEGKELRKQLQEGLFCHRRETLLKWGAPVEDLLLRSDAQVEVVNNTLGDTFFLTWPDEMVLNGLEGDILASFPPDLPVLNYVTLSPADYAIFGPAEDGLWIEWEHLTRLFGVPERMPGSGYRWSFDNIEISLLYRSCNEFHYAEDFHKWIAVHQIGALP